MATHFQFNWLQDPKFKDWLQQVPSDNTKAHCKICNFTMFLSNMGRSALTSHSKRKEHQRRMKASLQSPQLQCFSVLGVSSKSPTVGDSSESFPNLLNIRYVLIHLKHPFLPFLVYQIKTLIILSFQKKFQFQKT